MCIRDRPNSHSKLLANFVQDILHTAKKEASELDAISVSEGPGSYTGLRIGVSIAKGIAYASNIPLIAIDTLQILVENALEKTPQLSNENVIFCPMIDAKRMEVYTAFYGSNAEKISETTNMIIDEHSFLTALNHKKIFFCGNGSQKCKNVIVHQHGIFLDDVYPLARNMTKLAIEKYTENNFVDTAYFEPFYLKPFIATTPKNQLI